MRKKPSIPNRFLALLILAWVIGCQSNSNQQKKQSQNDTSKQRSKRKVEKAVPGSNCDTTLISQEFSSAAMAFDIFKGDTNKVKSLFLDPVTLKMDKDTDEEGKPYYLHHFTDGVNKIILLKNGGFYIKDAEINNNRVLLNKKISIGMKRGAFLKVLNAKNIQCDTITVKDEELTFESVYIFKDDKLRQIEMGSIVE